MNLTRETIEQEGALRDLEPDWWELFRRVPAATPFQSPAWLVPWWRVFAPGRLKTVAIRRAGRLVGLAPFYLAEDGRILPVGISVSDYLDVLVDPAEAAGVNALLGRAIADALGEGAVEWEMTELQPGAQAFGIAPDADRDTSVSEVCPVLQLDAGPLAAIVPSGKMRDVRLARNRAGRAGGWSVEAVADDRLAEAFAALVRLHSARWTGRGGGVFSDPRVVRFNAEALPRLARAGLLDLLVCRCEGAVAGIYYGLRRGDRAYAYLHGFDPALEYFSPGTQLVAAAIEAAITRGAREFHFLRGSEAYKYRWGAADRPNRRRVFRPAPAHVDA